MEEREGRMEGGRLMQWASQMKGDTGRETSKDFNVTAFHTDNSASASPSMHVG